MTARPQVGDIFAIPLGDGRYGLGQVVGTYGPETYYFAVLRDPIPATAVRDANVIRSEFEQNPPAFLALSMDAKLHAGDWTVIGRAPVMEAIRLPAYKEIRMGETVRIEVVDHSGVRRRPATPTEAAELPNRTVVAPVRLERALRASLGLELWKDEYADLRAGALPAADELFVDP